MLIDHIDGENRKIYLSSETVDASIHPIDIYKEMRTLRRTNEELRKYIVFMKAYGNVPKSTTTSTERYVVMQEGCKIVPYDTSHVLTVTGTIITDTGMEGIYCFDRTNLSDGVVVDISYTPKQVEVVTISSGSGLSQEEHDKLLSLDTSNLDVAVSSRKPNVKDFTDTDRALLNSINDKVTLLDNTTNGNWELKDNQMIIYDKDNNELFRFNTYDRFGNPSIYNVAKRTRV